jgi:hypothetical protein
VAAAELFVAFCPYEKTDDINNENTSKKYLGKELRMGGLYAEQVTSFDFNEVCFPAARKKQAFSSTCRVQRHSCRL